MDDRLTLMNLQKRLQKGPMQKIQVVNWWTNKKEEKELETPAPTNQPSTNNIATRVKCAYLASWGPYGKYNPKDTGWSAFIENFTQNDESIQIHRKIDRHHGISVLHRLWHLSYQKEPSVPFPTSHIRNSLHPFSFQLEEEYNMSTE